MATVELDFLDNDNSGQREQAIAILVDSFEDHELYAQDRLGRELQSSPPPFYRQFFVAHYGNEVLAVGGVKAADWASDTHLLYLSAVAPEQRGKGLARAVLAARLEWIRSNNRHGRVLVSSARTRRFKEAGFRTVGHYRRIGRELLLLEF